MINLATLTSQELATLHRDVLTQIAHRASLATMEADSAATNERYLRATGREPGQPWEQPSGAHDAYPAGWEVTHDNKTWQSLTPANVWEPGDPSDPQAHRWWAEVAEGEPGDIPTWSPTGHAYSTGDRVTFEGFTYECLQTHASQPGWDPLSAPALWSAL